MPSQISAVDDVVNTAHSLVDEIENAFKGLEMSDKIPTLREAEQSFVNALLTYRNSVLQEVIAHAIEQGLDYPRKSVPTFYAQLRTWQEEVDWRQYKTQFC
jgi:hypothetical protein